MQQHEPKKRTKKGKRRWPMLALFEIALGGFFMWLAPNMTHIKGALSRTLGPPPTRTQRVIFFLLGLVVAIDGVIRLFGGNGLEIRLRG
jgi:hypothetical protein